MRKHILLSLMLAFLLPTVAGAAECRFTAPAMVTQTVAGRTPTVVAIMIRTADGRPAYGTGVIWDGAGHVVTNDHVAAAGDGYLVGFADGTSRSARLVARAPERDIAILAVYGDLPEPAPRARSRDLKPGDPVVAIGNPFGRGLSLAGGIVSGFEREIITGPATRLSGMLQTTVALNPGSSGGPLFDCGGRVVGINTAVSRSGKDGEAMGFAIPIERVSDTVTALLDTRRRVVDARQPDARRPGLGLYVAPDAVGALVVQRVIPNSPADRAGARPGDAITHANGHDVHTSAELQSLVHQGGVGAVAVLRVVRSGQKVDMAVPVQPLLFAP